jgi:hypothetical protein
MASTDCPRDAQYGHRFHGRNQQCAAKAVRDGTTYQCTRPKDHAGWHHSHTSEGGCNARFPIPDSKDADTAILTPDPVQEAPKPAKQEENMRRDCIVDASCVQDPCGAHLLRGGKAWQCTRERLHRGRHHSHDVGGCNAVWEPGQIQVIEQPKKATKPACPEDAMMPYARKDGRQCREEEPADGRIGYLCTRPEGHAGEHHSHDPEGTCRASWQGPDIVERAGRWLFRVIGYILYPAAVIAGKSENGTPLAADRRCLRHRTPWCLDCLSAWAVGAVGVMGVGALSVRHWPGNVLASPEFLPLLAWLFTFVGGILLACTHAYRTYETTIPYSKAHDSFDVACRVAAWPFRVIWGIIYPLGLFQRRTDRYGRCTRHELLKCGNCSTSWAVSFGSAATLAILGVKAVAERGLFGQGAALFTLWVAGNAITPLLFVIGRNAEGIGRWLVRFIAHTLYPPCWLKDCGSEGICRRHRRNECMSCMVNMGGSAVLAFSLWIAGLAIAVPANFQNAVGVLWIVWTVLTYGVPLGCWLFAWAKQGEVPASVPMPMPAPANESTASPPAAPPAAPVRPPDEATAWAGWGRLEEVLTEPPLPPEPVPDHPKPYAGLLQCIRDTAPEEATPEKLAELAILAGQFEQEQNGGQVVPELHDALAALEQMAAVAKSPAVE